MLAFLTDLGPVEWAEPSRAEGWSVQDVVAHMGAACRAPFTPAVLTIMSSKDIERTNDAFVDARRPRPAQEVLAEYRRWSGMLATSAEVLGRAPLRVVPMPLGELGAFPVGMVVCGAMTFDHHTHLRHDIAPALDRPAPATDPERLALTTEWMLAVLGKQLQAAPSGRPAARLRLRLTGDGGGAWEVATDGTITPDRARPAAAEVSAPLASFPDWGTRRTPWRESSVDVTGDADVAAAFLDTLRVV